MPETKQDILEQTHPDYDALSPDWQLYSDAYRGGRDWTDGGYLFKFVREPAGDYEDRQTRAYYLNYVRAIIDAYVSFVYREEITRTADNGALLRFWDEADQNDNPIQAFMAERAAPLVFAFGTLYAGIDKPTLADGTTPASRADESAMGLTPRANIVSPLRLRDWGRDALGAFSWVRIQEDLEYDAGPWAERADAGVGYRTWTATEWALNDADGITLEEGTHVIGEVPIVSFVPFEDPFHTRQGLSVIRDIAPLARQLFNVCSLLDEFLYKQCFNILAIDSEWFNDESRRTLGISNAIPTYKDGVEPKYISPPVDPAEFLQEERKRIIAEIYRLAFLEYRTAERAGQPQSGIAKAYDLHDLNQYLAKLAQNLEAGERHMARLVLRWSGVKGTNEQLNDQFEVNYPRDFQIEDAAEVLDSALSAVELGMPSGVTKALKKRAAKVILGEDYTDEMGDEIDAAADEPARTRAVDALGDQFPPLAE